MKQSNKKHYTLGDGTIVFFNYRKLKSAVLAKKVTLEKAGQKCSQQTILEQIAEDASISLSAIKHWCAGHHSPSDLGKIQDIASALDIDMSYLLDQITDSRKDIYSMSFDIFESKSPEDIWIEVIKTLSKELSPAAVTIWLSDCKPVAISDLSLVLCTTSNFKQEVLKSRFCDKIKSILANLFSWDGNITVLAGMK